MSADRYAYLPTMVVVPYASTLFAQVLQDIEPECIKPESEANNIPPAMTPSHDKNAVITPKEPQVRRAVVAGVTCLVFMTVANISASLMDTWRNEPSAYNHSLR